jgi:hypothetical protein
MTKEAQIKAISDATGLCPKCDFLNDPEAIRQAEDKLGIYFPQDKPVTERLGMLLKAIGKWE